MTKKKISALLIGLAMAAALPMNAFATNEGNVNSQDDTIDKPGHKEAIAGERPGYDTTDGNTQTAGASYGFAVADSDNGTDWKVQDDDDGIDETGIASSTHKTDINVWARISDASAKIYKIDIAWGSMKFEFNDGSGAWNVNTHTYDGATGGTPHWVNSAADGTTGIDEQTGYEVGANGTNNKISVTNHSNSAVDAAFDYQMMQNARASGAGSAATQFNDGGGNTGGAWGDDYGDGVAAGSYSSHAAHDVIGYFYGSNAEAAKGHYAIADTYNGGNATDADQWKYDNGSVYADLPDDPALLKRIDSVDATKVTNPLTPAITLPTAEQIGDGSHGDWAEQDALSLAGGGLEYWNILNWANGERKANVYFAFSGQPDKGQGALLPTFTKVGVITVTITPNTTADYNRPATP